MTAATHDDITVDAPIETWFGVGGGADRLAAPRTVDRLRTLVAEAAEAGEPVRVLGDGANLLVADEGVDGLVVSLDRFRTVETLEEDGDGAVWRLGAGARLQRLVVESVRAGLFGLEGLGGVPASLGGAVVMNAGGAFGEIGDVVERVFGVTRAGEPVLRERAELAFGYRESSASDLIITGADLRLGRGDPEELRSRLKDVMARKKATQPLAERSAGCAFRNPLVGGERLSAGRLIDEAGAKGMAVGGASVSTRHANFIVTGAGATASDVIALLDRVRRRVLDASGVELEREVVIWSRGDTPTGE